jgi:uncharacterized protein (DUF1778 family)
MTTRINRVITFRLRLTPEERAEIERKAAEAGQTASQYVRDRALKS